MSSVAESKVTTIVKSLSSLENDLDALHSRVSEMKKNLLLLAQNEINALENKVRETATKEAEIIINQAKEKANSQASKIAQDGESKLGEIQAQIDANFDEAVKHVVSTVLKA